MYGKILKQFTKAKVECLLSSSQFGFRKGRGCTDATFTLWQLREKSQWTQPQPPYSVCRPREGFWSSQQRQALKDPWAIRRQGTTAGQHQDNLCQKQECIPHIQWNIQLVSNYIRGYARLCSFPTILCNLNGSNYKGSQSRPRGFEWTTFCWWPVPAKSGQNKILRTHGSTAY